MHPCPLFNTDFLPLLLCTSAFFPLSLHHVQPSLLNQQTLKRGHTLRFRLLTMGRGSSYCHDIRYNPFEENVEEGGRQKVLLLNSNCCSKLFSRACINVNCTCSLVVELLNVAKQICIGWKSIVYFDRYVRVKPVLATPIL